MDDSLKILKAFCTELKAKGMTQLDESHRAFFVLALIKVIHRIEKIEFEEIMQRDDYWEKYK